MYGCIVTQINIGKIESFLLLVTDLQAKLQTNLGSTFENFYFKYLNLILSNVDALSTFFHVILAMSMPGSSIGGRKIQIQELAKN